MDNINFPFSYTTADGAEGLAAVLETFLTNTKADAQFAAESHYILFKLGAQRSIIKVNMSEKPFQFWYYDLLGRPMTNFVKEVIAKFLWEKCGEKELYLQETAKGEL